eukprot:CAMPEP_0114239146 /NCGR_PEP_ID=MMETSP0058-20121206/8295_1 /TAXON_ID=36894 /ORGANISM="Pyramimonas parkeae, CCMP726" /LENGTH=133 /DNA_ID=CAMNT_0001351289 /DNA_START=140 /DNA_END=541 /DNA_ORIENTATION=-
MPSLEGTIQLDEIIRIKALFDEVEEQCPEGIELEDFITQFGPLIGPNLTRLELSHLFMKIDADSNGSIDWDEFSNYMFLDNKTEQMNNEIWTLLQKDFPIEEEAAVTATKACAPASGTSRFRTSTPPAAATGW